MTLQPSPEPESPLEVADDVEEATGAPSPAPPPAPARDLMPKGGAMGGDAAPPLRAKKRKSASPKDLEWVAGYANEIRCVDDGIQRVTTGGLSLPEFALGFGGVPTTPSWNRVADALAQEQAGVATFEGARAIREYARRLRAYTTVVGHALLWAAALRALARSAGRSDTWTSGMDLLARGRRFRHADRLWLTEQLESTELLKMLASTGVELPSVPRPMPREGDWTPILRAVESIEAAVDAAGDVNPPHAAWEDTKRRVYQHLDHLPSAQRTPTESELACLAMHRGPAEHLFLTSLETQNWEEVLTRMEARAPKAGQLVWVQAAALIAVGRPEEVERDLPIDGGDPFALLARSRTKTR